MGNPYRAQAADVALAEAERIASHVDVADVLAQVGAHVGALIAAAEVAVGQALRPDTGRTTALPSTRRTESGVVPVRRTMGRGTDADDYEVCESPLGRPESLASARAVERADRDDLRWAVRNVLADAGLLTTRKQRQNAKRAARRRKATGR
jgi:hypothetical protein